MSLATVMGAAATPTPPLPHTNNVELVGTIMHDEVMLSSRKYRSIFSLWIASSTTVINCKSIAHPRYISPMPLACAC